MALRPGGFHFARSLVVPVAITIAMFIGGTSAVAAKSPTVSTTGNDISWPQCGRTFPSGQVFGIVGVNDGLANTLNPCLGEYKGGPSTSELYWAWGSPGSPKLPTKVGLSVNTADPGPAVADWPTSGTDPRGDTCVGSDSPACAWQYGWNRAVQDIAWLATAAAADPLVREPTAASAYTWWLDVETANSWETGPGGLLNNVADLQGMVAAFEAANVPAASVGIYSTSYQWGVITGSLGAGNLIGLHDWIPGARTLSGAMANCSLPGFTGLVTITQWFGRPYDGDWAC
jgi:hypothetical protein